MSEEVTLSVRAELDKILADLEGMNTAVRKVQDSLKSNSKSVSDAVEEGTKTTTTFLDRLKGMASSAAEQIKNDFKSLASLESLKSGLAISNQFKGVVQESVSLNDQIRKLGVTLGMTKGQFANFKNDMVKGLGDIGLSSSVASKTLEGSGLSCAWEGCAYRVLQGCGPARS